MTAADHLVEAAETDWTLNESHTMSFAVTPTKVGTLWVRVRTTMHREGAACVYENDVSATSCGTTADQQGWTVVQCPVTVIPVPDPPDPDLVSVSGVPTSPVTVNTPFTVTVTAKNLGARSDNGAINASVRYSDGTDDVTVVRRRSHGGP